MSLFGGQNLGFVRTPEKRTKKGVKNVDFSYNFRNWGRSKMTSLLVKKGVKNVKKRDFLSKK